MGGLASAAASRRPYAAANDWQALSANSELAGGRPNGPIAVGTGMKHSKCE